MFNEQFANMSVAALLQVATDTSNKINKLINTPFCTLKQMEDLQNEVLFNRVFLKAIGEELFARQMSEEEIAQFKNIIF